jgi:hypothetical protein
MKGISAIGIVLIIVGIIGFAVGRFSFTTEEKVLDIGPIEASVDKKHDIAIPDVAAGLALVAGVLLVVVGMRKA